MIEELLVGAYLAELDRAVSRAIRLPEAGPADTRPVYGRLQRTAPLPLWQSGAPAPTLAVRRPAA